MRARLKFTTDSVDETLVGILKDHNWWPHFERESPEALDLTSEVRDSLDEGDVALFDGSRKYVLSHTGTESRGMLSHEHRVWVLRLLNANIHLLQLACQVFVTQLVEHAARNNKKIAFEGPIQIVERKRKETIIEGQTLATAADRLAYARSHRTVEFRIVKWGSAAFGLLLFLTYPWSLRDLTSHSQTWLFSVLEKLIGSVAVTTFIAWLQYRSFFDSLREHTIRWSIPGEPEKRDVKPHAS